MWISHLCFSSKKKMAKYFFITFFLPVFHEYYAKTNNAKIIKTNNAKIRPQKSNMANVFIFMTQWTKFLFLPFQRYKPTITTFYRAIFAVVFSELNCKIPGGREQKKWRKTIMLLLKKSLTFCIVASGKQSPENKQENENKTHSHRQIGKKVI